MATPVLVVGLQFFGLANTSGSLSGGEPATTNNRMELQAAISALMALKEPCDVTLFTDSEYLRGGITEWLPMWKANHWRTADRKPVKNDDLWRQLDEASMCGRGQNKAPPQLSLWPKNFC